MGQTKGIAIRIDSELLQEIENHQLGRNDLVIQAIESYLHEATPKSKSSSKKKTETSSTWSEIEENSKKLNNISKKQKTPQKNSQAQQSSTESLTDDLYNEVYSTIYNTEVTPLKKQLKLKDDLIHTLQQQNIDIKEDKKFLFDHIAHLEERIPKKRSWLKKTNK
jgi:uncharacterized protein YdcH (DUF465 family)